MPLLKVSVAHNLTSAPYFFWKLGLLRFKRFFHRIQMAGSDTDKVCLLRSVEDPTKVIALPHNKAVVIGRNEETGIKDVHVSRSHLECTADVETGKVTVKTLGLMTSGVNGFALHKNETYTLKHGDRLEVRFGFHPFDIVFKSPSDDAREPEPKKAKLTDFFGPSSSGASRNSASSSSTSSTGAWEDADHKELLIFTSKGCEPRAAIAGFDMDGTLIKTKSGARFPKDFKDWELIFGDVQKKIQKLHDDDYKVVIFSNQAGLGRDEKKIKGFKGKVEAIIAKIGVPMQAFVATGKAIYRKPAPGMWTTLCDAKNGDVTVDTAKSFYVGDAAGRAKNWAPKKNKDHSVADRLFAKNIGLRFYTPEEHFLKASPAKFEMPEFDPSALPDLDYPPLPATQPLVVVMVGGPGSGKSSYCKSQLVPKGFVHVSRDSLGSWQKCAKHLEENLQKGRSVVVDNTNKDAESRKRYTEVAKRLGVDCKCFVMMTSQYHCKHNNRFRELTDKKHVMVSEIIINSHWKSFEEPNLAEGFSEIVKVPFVPKFDKREHEKLYRLHLVEK